MRVRVALQAIFWLDIERGRVAAAPTAEWLLRLIRADVLLTIRADTLSWAPSRNVPVVVVEKKVAVLR